MHAIVALISSVLSLGFILFNYLQVFKTWEALHTGSNSPNIISIGISVKLACIALGVIALIFSIQYTKLGWKKYYTINRIARFIAIVGIIFSLVPITWFLQ